MPVVRGLTVVVVGPDRDRLTAAITMTAAAAALGWRARLYFDARAVALLADADLSLAHDSDVELIACQTGLAEAALVLPDGVAAGGLISLLADLGEDRLVTL